MSGIYQFWLTNDAGKNITPLQNYIFFSYTRTTTGYGILEFGMAYRDYVEMVPNLFQVDWRIDVWRSPGDGYDARREGSFLLRKFSIYERETDGVQVIVFFGRSPLDILRRQSIHDRYISVNEAVDDTMKNIVRYYYETYQQTANTAPVIWVSGSPVYTGEFVVEGNVSLGPLTSRDVLGPTVLDELQNLKSISVLKNSEDPANLRIYFDVIESDGLVLDGFGYIFKTYAGLRGMDRTAGKIFSVSNGSIKQPVYYESYLDECTVAWVDFAGGAAVTRSIVEGPNRNASRWNYSKILATSRGGYGATDDSDAGALLRDNAPEKKLNCIFVNSPGGELQPRSLYGLDWDLGDMLPVEFAGKIVNCEVRIIYVAVDENGIETLTGRSEVGSE